MFDRKVPDYSLTSPAAMLLLAVRDLNQYGRHPYPELYTPGDGVRKRFTKHKKVNPHKKHSNQRYWR